MNTHENATPFASARKARDNRSPRRDAKDPIATPQKTQHIQIQSPHPMKTRILTLAFIASLAASAPLHAEPAAPPPPELKALEQLVGKWRVEAVSHKAEWT